MRPAGQMMRPGDIRVRNVAFSFENYTYRTPIKFGGVALDQVTLLNVACRRGNTVRARLRSGFGSMPLGNVWSFPSRMLSYDQTLACHEVAGRARSPASPPGRANGHPIDINWRLEPLYLKAADETSRQLATGRADPEALHAGGGQRLRRRPARRLRQSPRPQLLPQLFGPDFVTTTWVTTWVRSSRASGWIATSSRRPSRACRSITWSVRSIRSSRATSRQRIERRPAGDAGGMDRQPMA